MAQTTGRVAKILAAATAVAASLLFAGITSAAAAPAHGRAPQFRVRQILNGARLHHSYLAAGSKTRKTEALSSPDDVTVLGHHIFTAFQNGVGPQGQASPDGNTLSTVVEFTAGGHVVRQWDIKGKCDGITADTGRHELIATVNEDAHSGIYTITPGAPAQVQHYRYNVPLPSRGGTDAISITDGQVLVSASAPGTTGKAAPQPSYPAVYVVTFDRSARVARVRPLFYDESRATVANLGAGHGKVVRLALTDPDSNENVPASGPRFGGDFMLTSQGDKEQIFVRAGRGHGRDPRLSVLRLSQSVDDTAWARNPHGALYGADTSSDTIDVVTGHFRAHSIFVAVTPCDADNAPATCPAPGFPPNYLGSLNPWTGHITRVRPGGPSFEPQGMIFIGRSALSSCGPRRRASTSRRCR